MRARGGPRLPAPLLLVVVPAILSGCAWKTLPPAERHAPAPAVSAPAPQRPVHPPEPPAAAQPVPPQPAPAPSLPASYAAGMAALREGKPERALGLFAAALKEKPGNPEISRRFDEALAGLKNQGNAAYAQGKPEAAGKRWVGALRYIDWAAARGMSHPSIRTEVQARLDRLTAEQMERGLICYRKGDIPGAIVAWRTILAYDPENEEAARAVRTASTQLENLKKIPTVQ